MKAERRLPPAEIRNQRALEQLSVLRPEDLVRQAVQAPERTQPPVPQRPRDAPPAPYVTAPLR